MIVMDWTWVPGIPLEVMLQLSFLPHRRSDLKLLRQSRRCNNASLAISLAEDF